LNPFRQVYQPASFLKGLFFQRSLYLTFFHQPFYLLFYQLHYFQLSLSSVLSLSASLQHLQQRARPPFSRRVSFWSPWGRPFSHRLVYSHLFWHHPSLEPLG
jgi:hypothetical protein